MTGVMSYAADRTEDAEQGAPTESATQNADAPESAAEVIGASATELPAAPTGSADPGPAVTGSDTAHPDAAGSGAGDATAETAPSVAAPEEPTEDAPSPAPDPWPVDLPADVVDLARAAAATEAGTADRIGEHVDSIAEDPIARTVRFAALDAGYRGWQWSVTLALLPDEPPTVSEVVLLPGPDALVAPTWLPWDQRVRPGDLGTTDLLPAAVDDPRLVPGYVESDDPALEALATEVGLGRERVLSREGRDDAADRWHDGPFGPGSPVAKAAPGLCGSCGFYLPLAGSLGGAFGVCANDLSPADARVVDVAFGCGAHSEVPAPPPAVPMGGTVLDEVTLEVHHRPRPTAETGEVDESLDGAEDAEHVIVADAGIVDDTGVPEGADPVARDVEALTDAAETAPTLDVAAEAGDLDVTPPTHTVDDPAATAPQDGQEPVAESVAVEPESVTAAGAISGSEAEIVVTDDEVTDEDVTDEDLAASSRATRPTASPRPGDRSGRSVRHRRAAGRRPGRLGPVAGPVPGGRQRRGVAGARRVRRAGAGRAGGQRGRRGGRGRGPVAGADHPAPGSRVGLPRVGAGRDPRIAGGGQRHRSDRDRGGRPGVVAGVGKARRRRHGRAFRCRLHRGAVGR